MLQSTAALIGYISASRVRALACLQLSRGAAGPFSLATFPPPRQPPRRARKPVNTHKVRSTHSGVTIRPDGRMVPKISFGPPIVAACRKEFPSTVFDVKLGIFEPERRISDFARAGADVISVHPESTVQLGAVINLIREADCAAGVVLNPATPVSAVEHVLDECAVAVVMLVNPGYGGPKYMDTAKTKIAALRERSPHLHISVDGGVSSKNAHELVDAGANVLVAGGSVFSAPNKRAALDALRVRAS